MPISQLIGSYLRGVFPVLGIKQPSQKLDFSVKETPLYKMAYYANKFGGEDEFKRSEKVR